LPASNRPAFLAELGDKTQLATVALAARHGAFLAVVAGTTLGMLIASVPVVFLGERVTRKLPLRVIRVLATGLFALMGSVAAVLSCSNAWAQIARVDLSCRAPAFRCLRRSRWRNI